MSRVYTAAFEGVSVTAVQDFFELTCASTCVAAIHEINITQDAVEVSEQLPVRILRVPATVTSGSGGTSPSIRRNSINDSTALSTIEANNTTVATTSGTLEVLRRIGDNVLNGWRWLFTPEMRIWLPPSGVVVVRLVTAPAASTAMSGDITWEEF